LPAFLAYFGLVCIAGVWICFSIAELPFGIGNLFREVLASFLMAGLLWLVLSILHLLIPF
jgi:hypothetical protein|tara:strand:+ start:602 stop:781 length:180 start_codon:yes stop_codon:yes gene_type:complete